MIDSPPEINYHFDFYTSHTLFDREKLNRLQAVLVKLAPGWCRDARFWEDEYIVKTSVKVDLKQAGAIYDYLNQLVPGAKKASMQARKLALKHFKALGQEPPFPFDPERFGGNFMMMDRVQDLMLLLDYANRPRVDLMQNRVSLNLYTRKFEDISSTVWCLAFLEQILAHIEFDYGRLFLVEEFYGKNHDEKGNVIGVHNQVKTLSGLYWQNFFGPILCDVIGRDKLLTAPAHHVREFPHGILLTLGKDPHDWDTPEYQEREQAVEAHLGKEFFFNRDDPDRKLRQIPFPNRFS